MSISNFKFWKKISRYVLIGLVAGMFTAFSQSFVLAEEDNCLDGNEFSCPEPGSGGEGEQLPLPDYPTPYAYPTPEYAYPTPYTYPTPEYSTPAPEYSYPTPYTYPTPAAPSYATPPQGAPAAPAVPSFNISNTNENTNTNNNNNTNNTTVTNNSVNQNSNSSSSTSSSNSTNTTNVSVSQPQGAQGGVVAVPRVVSQPAVLAAVTQPQVQVKELPKTGLPLLAWAAGAFIPAGLGLKRFGKKLVEDMVDHPQFMWEERQFKRD